jgi:hypothetical protein
MSDYYAEPILDTPLFPAAAPAVRGSATSRAAAVSLPQATRNAMQERVYRFLCACPHGATDEEMQQRLAMNPSTQRPRRIELVKQGLVAEGGTRKTQSGRNAVVWLAVRQGEEG